ncbi:hypothetical protein ARMSODRAFT_1028174 [Armillaria solidipes]|uniref:Uncharacterized protein n=1 Tax=Armillaria solidipes TaxID=1076256 RepID=A0A2H3ALB4_9AGAR|nr:hypothetical protein ARMSODRAFT_1028174 [Armillaria solidipes]
MTQSPFPPSVRNILWLIEKFQTIWLMNVFNAGSRVSFYDSAGRLVNGTVQSITRTSDGAQLVLIKRDNGNTITLPSASVFKT